MRNVLPTLLLAALLAGCAGTGGTTTTSTPTGTPPPPHPLPAAIRADDTMPPSLDPLGSGGPACSPPQSTCFRYPFHLDGNATATARLTWTVPANDLDLYLMQGGAVVDKSTAGASTQEATTTELGAGDYAFVVQGSTAVAERFHLEADFAAPR